MIAKAQPTLQRLTRQQLAILLFIQDRLSERAQFPSYREIADHFGFLGPHSVTCHLAALQRKGYLTKPGKRARLFHLHYRVLSLHDYDGRTLTQDVGYLVLDKGNIVEEFRF